MGTEMFPVPRTERFVLMPPCSGQGITREYRLGQGAMHNPVNPVNPAGAAGIAYREAPNQKPKKNPLFVSWAELFNGRS